LPRVSIVEYLLHMIQDYAPLRAMRLLQLTQWHFWLVMCFEVRTGNEPELPAGAGHVWQFFGGSAIDQHGTLVLPFGRLARCVFSEIRFAVKGCATRGTGIQEFACFSDSLSQKGFCYVCWMANHFSFS